MDQQPDPAGPRLGIVGRQSRPGADWGWTARRLREALAGPPAALRAFSSLAAGADQLFAREALALGIPVAAVIPMPDYARCFAPEDLPAYHDLPARCDPEILAGEAADEEAFFAAGRRVAEACDLLVAVWDGKPAGGRGGTADAVAYGLEIGRPILHLNPLTRAIKALGSASG